MRMVSINLSWESFVDVLDVLLLSVLEPLVEPTELTLFCGDRLLALA